MSRRPRTRRVIDPPEDLALVPCPGCGVEGVEHPGYVHWAAQWLAKTGELPPPEPFGVPSWAWWCCSACGDLGAHMPEEVAVVVLRPGQHCPWC